MQYSSMMNEYELQVLKSIFINLNDGNYSSDDAVSLLRLIQEYDKDFTNGSS